jgi:fructuronate reductase
VLACDNLASNGALTRRLVTRIAAAAGAVELTEWLEESVAFPCTMVDRIVPAATEDDRRDACRILGVRDFGLVVAEPFGQWVIEDRFAGPRPAWERAGATLTADVEPYEVAKLRMLNATHSLLAYLGALKGFSTIAEAVADPDLAGAARRLQSEDVIPTLSPPPGLDLESYGEDILTRFSNPALGHTTLQVAMDGSEKLPIRVLGTVADRLATGAVPYAAALVVAAWMAFVHRGRDIAGRSLTLDDPQAGRLREAAAGTDAGLVDRMMALRGIFTAEVAEDSAFREAVAGHLARLLKEVP